MTPFQKKQTAVMFCLVFSVLACRRSSGLNAVTERLASMECRAIALRHQRFSLADSIRFTQDTLLRPQTTDTARLSAKLVSFAAQKEKLTHTSLLLADSIRLLLDSLRKEAFQTKEDKDAFDENLQKRLREKGCNGQ